MENMYENYIVAIDGEAGTGKSSISKSIAKKMNIVYMDTGAMYRCVTLAMINQNISLDEIEKIEKLLSEIQLDVKPQNGEDRFFLNGEDVTKQIREPRVNELVSQVSQIQIVRNQMVDLQRKLAQGKKVIMEGRDIGTNVFPNAQVKIYLSATPEERAKRRFLQDQEKGIESSYEEILKNIIFRDQTDKNRDVAPLKKADDAVEIDTTNYTQDEVEKMILDVIKERVEANA